jgi:uncharacterized protein YbgA (DUF1722 family)/uncharacterized protein YbbK (DUF523 family)
MRKFVKPRVVISKCLGFAHCRYNGLIIADEFVKKLRSYVEFNAVCPEVEIGLGIPRKPVRLVSMKGKLRLIQPATQNDLTEKMNHFTDSFLRELVDVDGFLLKNRSPSCGIKDVKIYPGLAKVASIGRGAGFFGGTISQKFPYSAVEDEGRLRNVRIREHFLTKLFTIARFRCVKDSGSFKELVQFHTENKFLLMAYNQKDLRSLGKIAANPEKNIVSKVMNSYQQHFFNAFSRAPSYRSTINVLTHVMGYFKKDLSHREKTFFLESTQKYRDGVIPLSVITSLLNSWKIRFEEDYLMHQTFFEPYPEELMVQADFEKELNF